MQLSESPHTATFLEYLHVARRRWWVIFLTVAVAGTAAYIISSRSTPVYQAQAEVLLRPATATASVNGSTASIAVPTELRIVSGFPVSQAVQKALPHAAPLSQAAATSTSSFSVTSKSTDPKLAAESANAYVNAYIELRRSDALRDLLAVTDQLQAKVTDLQRQIDALGPPPAAGPTRVATAADLQRAALQNQQDNYRIQMNDMQLRIGSVSAGAVVLSPAGVPSTPVAPTPVRTAGEAAAGGLILGLALAFLMEYLDTTVKSTDGLRRVTRDLPILGVIPTVPGWRDGGQTQLITSQLPNSPVSESYRSLRTALYFVGLDRPVNVIHVTSPASKDGKTTTVANLGVVLAQVGGKIVIVDLDLRRPRVHTFFGLSNHVGFSSVVLGDAPLSTALQEVPEVPGLLVLPAGPTPSSPSELLSSPRAAAVVAELRDSGLSVVLDSPPLLPVSDALVVSKMADASLLVTSAGLTKTTEIIRALELLDQVHAPLVGIVFNRSGTIAHYSYGYSESRRAGSNGRSPSPPVKARALPSGSKAPERTTKKVPAKPRR